MFDTLNEVFNKHANLIVFIFENDVVCTSIMT